MPLKYWDNNSTLFSLDLKIELLQINVIKKSELLKQFGFCIYILCSDFYCFIMLFPKFYSGHNQIIGVV
jgi:hypothetical protein